MNRRACTPPGRIACLAISIAIAGLACQSPVRVLTPHALVGGPQADPLVVAFLSSPDFVSPRISPDGRRIAVLRSRGERDEIVVLSGEDWQTSETWGVEKRAPIGLRASRFVRMLGWPSDDTFVYAIDTPLLSPEDGIPRSSGRESRTLEQEQRGRGLRLRKTRLYGISLERGRRYLAEDWPDAPISQRQDRIIDWLEDDPEHFLVSYEGSVLRVNTQNGAIRNVERGFTLGVDWLSDARGAVRAGRRYESFGRELRLLLRRDETARWEEVDHYDPYLEDGLDFAGFTPQPGRFLVYSNRDRDRSALHLYDLDRGLLPQPILESPEFDLDTGRVLVSRLDHRLLAIETLEEGWRQRPYDAGFARLWEVVESGLPDREVRVVGSSADESRWLLQAESATSPTEVFVLDARSRRLVRVYDARPALRERALAETEGFTYRSRDGRSIRGQLTRPVGQQGPGPLVVMPHDGPLSRDTRSFDPVVQLLAARGYSVFQPAYRGSIGYGSAHRRAGYGEWGGAIVGDVVDGVRDLIRQGLADPERIGLFGTGFGGYLALQSGIREPALFAAVASYGAPTDLLAYMGRGRRMLARRGVDSVLIGDPISDRARIEAISPARGAARLGAPVLLAHGDQDPRFHPDHLRAMARALQDAGAEFEALLYPAQADWLIDEAARIDFFTRLLDFLDRHLRPGADAAPAGPTARHGVSNFPPTSPTPGYMMRSDLGR